MREALRGTWILQEYEDSIDAGLTPKLLEYMLDHRHSIGYYPDIKNGNTDPRYLAYLWHDKNNVEMQLHVSFKFAADMITFSGEKDKVTGSAPRPLIARFVINSPDTILRVYGDSSLMDSVDFVKYDNSKCQHVPAYFHLINSKFLAGKYYAVGDTGHRHHIIFTRCGTVEGAEYISSELSGCSDYEVQLANFSRFPDAIFFNNPEFKIGRPFCWEFIKDTLRLYNQYEDGHERSILLLKQ